MRLNTTLFTVGVLLGTALADIKTINATMMDVKTKTKDLAKAIGKWSGTASTGGEMLCKTVALRKSMDACVKVFQDSEPLKESDMKRFPVLPLIFTMFKLEDAAVKAKPRFDGIGATATLVEIIKAQKAPTSDMFKAMKVIMDKLPPSFKDQRLFEPASTLTISETTQKFIDNEINDFIKKLQPESKPLVPQEFVTPMVLMVAQASKSINTKPFCRSIPPFMNTLAGQSTNLGKFTNQALKVLDSSGVQDVVPLNVFKRSAEAFGVPPNVIPNVLKAIGVPEKGLPLREFTKPVPRLLSTNFSTVTKQALESFDFSRMQNVVIPLNSINNVAKASGIPPNFIPNVVKKIGLSEQRLSLSEITKRVPNLLSTKVSTLTTGALEILETSDVRDLAPLDVIKVAEVIGVSRDTTGEALKRVGISEQRLSLGEFTEKVPRLLNNLKFKNKSLGDMVLGDIVLGDMVLDTPTMIRFADSVVNKLLGSAPR